MSPLRTDYTRVAETRGTRKEVNNTNEKPVREKFSPRRESNPGLKVN